MNEVKAVHVDTVLVENSDARLAAVEYAKRTGEPLQSVSANKTEVVPYDVAAQIAEDKAHQNTYVGRFGATYAAHLESYHQKIEGVEGNEFVAETNEEKAAAHERYSAEVVRRQMEDEKRVREMIAEGYEPSLAVQQANLERAREHELKAIEYAQVRLQRNDEAVPVLTIVDESVRALRVEDLSRTPLEARAAILRDVPSVTVPDAMETETNDALVVKDKLIEAEIPYESEASPHEELVHRDRPGVEIMDAAGSPEALREGTALGQLAADNPTGEAREAQQEMEEYVDSVGGERATSEPGEVLREAEAAVGEVQPADEMPENPQE